MPEPQATPSFAEDLARLRAQRASALPAGGDFAADLAKLRATGPVAQTIPASAIGHPKIVPHKKLIQLRRMDGGQPMILA